MCRCALLHFACLAAAGIEAGRFNISGGFRLAASVWDAEQRGTVCGARADLQTAGLNGVFAHFCRRGQKWVAPGRETPLTAPGGAERPHKPFFGHFLSAKKVTENRPRAGARNTPRPSGAKHPRAGWRQRAQKKNHPGWFFFVVLVHSVMIRRITRSVSRMPCAASTPTWRTVSSTSVPRMPSPGRKLSPLRYMS